MKKKTKTRSQTEKQVQVSRISYVRCEITAIKTENYLGFVRLREDT